jgi:hypothetical protein
VLHTTSQGGEQMTEAAKHADTCDVVMLIMLRSLRHAQSLYDLCLPAQMYLQEHLLRLPVSTLLDQRQVSQ